MGHRAESAFLATYPSRTFATKLLNTLSYSSICLLLGSNTLSKEPTETSKVTTNQNSLFRSCDWLSSNQGPVLPQGILASYQHLHTSGVHRLFLVGQGVDTELPLELFLILSGAVSACLAWLGWEREGDNGN
eukprot:sb/3474975/